MFGMVIITTFLNYFQNIVQHCSQILAPDLAKGFQGIKSAPKEKRKLRGSDLENLYILSAIVD